ncbi:MAG: hypothetical protein Q7R49_01615 [Candidatus Daviesbacteria bacterium]|nr:hypothetical protein [Candidatus Daviesbacteria bacterium]
MNVFTDESGHFVESPNSEWGILVVCTITDKALGEFSTYYMNLLGENWPKAKASQLDFNTRRTLLKYIGRHPEIQYSAFIYDYKSTSGDSISSHKLGQVKKLEEAIERTRPIAKHQSLITSLELLRNQLRKLSSSDYLKVIMTFTYYKEWIQTFPFDYVYTNTSRDSWEMKHVFDMQNAPEKFVKLIYSLLYLTTNSLAGANFPLYFPTEWPKDHPYFQNYHTSEGTDMRKLLSNRRCGDDTKDIGLKLPDLISNTLLRSIQRQNEIQWIKILGYIKSSRSFLHKKGGRTGYYKTIAFPGGSDIHPSSKIKRHWDLMKQY